MSKHSFTSFADLGSAFAKLARREQRADAHGRRTVTKTARLAVQNRLGQKSLLLPELKLETQRERVRLGFTPDETLLRSGALRRSIEDAEIGPRDSGIGSALPYARIQELGGIIKGRPPKRSFLASTMREGDRKYFLQYVTALMRLLDL